MTLTQLKKDIKVGTKMQMTSFIWRYKDGTIDNGVPERVRPIRTVTYVDTTGYYLNATPENNKRGSFSNWPRAKDMTYNGSTLHQHETDKDTGLVYHERTYKLI